jgi:glycosyltransferase involved in cell wall biosynthesis
MNKPTIVFTFANVLGGVSSFNRNLINYSSLRKSVHTRVILLKGTEDTSPVFTDNIDADEIIDFPFSQTENQYYFSKRLNRYFQGSNVCIVTDNIVTLNALATMQHIPPISYLVHDYFYVEIALRFYPIIDIAIAHSSFFQDILCAANPTYYHTHSKYIPYGVPQPHETLPTKSNTKNLNVVFLGRLVEEKGVHLLYEMDEVLKSKNIIVAWTIIGNGYLKEILHKKWALKTNITFSNPPTSDGLFQLLKDKDILVLPTVFEGTPVSIIECLANGIVPVVSDLPGGIRDIVNDGIGFRCKIGDISNFTDKIEILHHNRALLKELQTNCFELAQKKYKVERASNNYFEVFTHLALEANKKIKKFSPFFYKLDRKYLPNKLVKFIRSLK